MLRNYSKQYGRAQQARPAAPRRRPGAVGVDAPMAQANGVSAAAPVSKEGLHPLVRYQENAQLYAYERKSKAAFDSIKPVLKKVSTLQQYEDFEARANALALERLGFELPADILADAWVSKLDMPRLYAWCVFETYRRFCGDFYANDPLGVSSGAEQEDSFNAFLQECGFHTMDVSPCADGRLAHVIRYAMRLPLRSVRRRSYAGAMFDIDDSMRKWIKTEMQRYSQGKPNTADAPTRYLKTVVYHFSSKDPKHEGCAAHGSDDALAAQSGLNRLVEFRQAVENQFCCGKSIDLLLVGMDTDTDSIRVHVPDAKGDMRLNDYVDSMRLYEQTRDLGNAQSAEAHVRKMVMSQGDASEGMVKLITRILVNNMSQILYVRQYFGQHYADNGHAERFIGAGLGFEEVQLRNLTYFAYLHTVEEATVHMDVGIKIFTGLNIKHGLPVPIVVRYDYHGQVPGARERAVQACERLVGAIDSRYPEQSKGGLLHTLQVIRDVDHDANIEVLGSSVNPPAQEAH